MKVHMKTNKEMTWHYQVFKIISKSKKHKPYFCIKEVYENVPLRKGIGWTKDSVAPIGDTKKELFETIDMMLKDAKHYKVKVEKEA